MLVIYNLRTGSYHEVEHDDVVVQLPPEVTEASREDGDAITDYLVSTDLGDAPDVLPALYRAVRNRKEST